MKKLIFAFLLFLSINSMYATYFTVNGINYSTLTTSTVEVSSGTYSGNITIPANVTYSGTTYSVTSIGDNAFKSCNGLTNIIIPSSVISIGSYAFAYCINITSFNIPNSLMSIGEAAYLNCSNLNSIAIPDSVISVGSSAFSGCTNLISITVSDKVASIGKNVFNNTAWYNNQLDGLVYIGKIAYSYKGTMLPNTSITIEDGTKGIAGGAFGYYSNLINIYIPYSVTSIGDWAFCYCDGLTNITLPDSLTSIGDYSFYYSGLKSIIIPNKVTIIGNSAFENCRSLANISIPNSVSYIGSIAFWNTPWFNNQSDGVVYAGKLAYSYKGTQSANTSITIAEGTIGIAGLAFNMWSGLLDITIPNSVVSIGDGAFYYCSGLTNITIPSSVTFVGNNTFEDCKNLKSISILGAIISIGDYTFKNCNALTSISIPSAVSSIGKEAFAYCTGFTSITIPGLVTTIKDFAFEYCSGLSNVTIPSSITSIGTGAFYSCTSLISIYTYATTPLDLSGTTSVFYNVNKTTCTLYVPKGSKALYKAANQWSDFSNIVEFDTSSIINPNQSSANLYYNPVTRELQIQGLDKTVQISVYNLDGLLVKIGVVSNGKPMSVKSLPKGIYVVKVLVNNEMQSQKVVI